MRIKGTVTKSIQEYVKNEQGDKYNSWIDSLPKSSQEIFKNSISVAEWYPVEEALIEPTKSAGRMFFEDGKNAAWELGRYSAETGLKGVYKVFVMISTAQFLISRSSRILSTMYENAVLNIHEKHQNSCLVHISKLPKNDPILEERIGGWMEKAIEICGYKEVNVNIIDRLTKGNQTTIIKLNWK